MSGGTKLDTGKPRMDLIPPEAKMAMGEVFGYGAKKYADRNWEKGLAWGRVAGALERHLTAWQAGEDEDPESTLPHLWHVITNAAMLVAMEVRGDGVDDRTTYCRSEADNDNGIVQTVKGFIDTTPEPEEDDGDDLTMPAVMSQGHAFRQGVSATRRLPPLAETALRLQAQGHGF